MHYISITVSVPASKDISFVRYVSFFAELSVSICSCFSSIRNVMADVCFDTVAASPESASPNRNRMTNRSFQDDVILISSDDESNYSDFDDGQSDTSLLSFDDLSWIAGCEDVGSGDVEDTCNPEFQRRFLRLM